MTGGVLALAGIMFRFNEFTMNESLNSIAFSGLGHVAIRPRLIGCTAYAANVDKP